MRKQPMTILSCKRFAAEAAVCSVVQIGIRKDVLPVTMLQNDIIDYIIE